MMQAVSAALLHFVWQGAIVGIWLSIVLAALRRRSANARYVVSCAALAGLALFPVVTTAVLYSQDLPMDLRRMASISRACA